MNPILAGVRATLEVTAFCVVVILGGLFYTLVHVLPCRYQELRERRP